MQEKNEDGQLKLGYDAVRKFKTAKSEAQKHIAEDDEFWSSEKVTEELISDMVNYDKNVDIR